MGFFCLKAAPFSKHHHVFFCFFLAVAIYDTSDQNIDYIVVKNTQRGACCGWGFNKSVEVPPFSAIIVHNGRITDLYSMHRLVMENCVGGSRCHP